MKLTSIEQAANYFKIHAKQCLKLWTETCWPYEVYCPHCDDDFERRGRVGQMRCDSCRRYIRPFTGSVLDGTRMNIATWFTVIWNSVQQQPVSVYRVAKAVGVSHSGISRINQKINELICAVKNANLWCECDHDRFRNLLRLCTRNGITYVHSCPLGVNSLDGALNTPENIRQHSYRRKKAGDRLCYEFKLERIDR